MAADEKREEAQKSAEIQNADKTKSVVVILIALSIIVMIATPVLTIFATQAMVSTQAPPGSKDVKADKNGEILIPGFKANVGGTRGTRYVNMDIVIQYTEPSAMERYFKAKDKDNPLGRLNMIKSQINLIIAGKQLDEIDSPGGLKNLAEEIKEAIKSCLPKDPKLSPGTITEVMFSNFLIS